MIQTSFYLQTLGCLSLHANGPNGPELIPSSKPLAVLAVLAILPEHSATREFLARLLWPDVDHSHARGSLRQALHKLSKVLDAELVIADDGTLTLDRNLLTVDVLELDRAIEAKDYERAVELWGGTFLAGLERKAGSELSHLIEAHNERVRAGVHVAYAQVIAAALRRDEYDVALGHARRFAADNPLDESAQATLIRVLRAGGNEAAAVQAFGAYQKLLEDTLEDEPEEELERMAATAREALVAPLALETRRTALNGLAEAAANVHRSRDSERRVTGVPIGAAVSVGVLAGIVTVALGFLGWTQLTGPYRVGAPLSRLSGSVPLGVHGPTVLEATLEDGSLRLIPRDSGNYAAHEVTSPDGRLKAEVVETVDGIDIALRDLETGLTTRVTEEPQDEYPMAWSPDGRQLLYVYGRPTDDGRDYPYRLAIYDLETAAHRTLDIRVRTSERWGVWSPDGTRIAFPEYDGRDERVVIAELDGRTRRVVSPPGERAAQPAWSPEGTHLAFTVQHPEFSDLFTVRFDGTALRQVTRTAASDRFPIWLSQDVLAFVSDRGGRDDLWVEHLPSGTTRRLTDRGDLRKTLPNHHYPAVPWLEKVRIQPRPEAVTPGQRVRLGLTGIDASGGEIASEVIPIRWSVGDTGLADLTEDGIVVIKGLGSLSITASAAGWRADTLEIVSLALAERELKPDLIESWRGGLSPQTWYVYGAPLPYARPEGGPRGGGVFINNGDNSFMSGAVTRESFPLRDGLTVEVWGQLPFSGKAYEDFTIDLLHTPPPGDSLDWRGGLAESLVLRFQISGRLVQARVARPGLTEHVPFPETPSAWHRYAIQVESDRRVSYIFDGQLRWRSPEPIPTLQGQNRHVHVGIGGAAYYNEVRHGPLRVYTGPRFFVGPKAPGRTATND